MIFCQSCADQGKSWFTTKESQMTNDKYQISKKDGIGDLRFEIGNSAQSAVGWYPEENLPVLLPEVKDFKPLGTGKAPLANYPEFYETMCPGCGGKATRETDVSDTFLDSSWYFFRYLATELTDLPIPMKESKSQSFKESTDDSRSKVEKRLNWLPVTSYIGGAEHAVLHLLYSRFVTMVLKDLGYIDFEEPFTRFRANGLIIKDGAKMSKSKGNVINPDDYVRKFGADTLRTYLAFIGPFTQGGDFQDSGIEGISRFLTRVWKLVIEFRVQNSEFRIGEDKNRQAMLHKTIKGVTEDMEELRFNTAIAKLMTYYNFLIDQKEQSSQEIETLLKLLAPFAPHMTEELWSRIPTDNKSVDIRGSNQWKSIHLEGWPGFDVDKISSDMVTIAVQINGKLRHTLSIQQSVVSSQQQLEDLAKNSENVKKHLEGKEIKKVIYVPGKILNFVI
jgi:leucyl-tRNA synthetase